MERIKAEHTIAPVYDERSKILILGSFPSVKSREAAFFYAHPQNRFWRVLASILSEPIPDSTEEKRSMLLTHGIALWDVIGSCEIEGSSDASIRSVVPNDLRAILDTAPIQAVFCNGSTAMGYYRRYQEKETGRCAIVLPSTSPANAACSLKKLVSVWQAAILPYLAP